MNAEFAGFDGCELLDEICRGSRTCILRLFDAE
jgi:hypothetical protein